MTTLSDALQDLDGKAELTGDDVFTLRQIIFADEQQLVTREEAEALFRLNGDAGAISKPWHDLFIEAITDFVVHQQHPTGYVDDAKADWLIAMIKGSKTIRGDVLEALTHIMEEADQTPARLDDFALDLVKRSMLAKIGRGAAVTADVRRMRRLLFAAGSDGNVAVTRREAELLFDINDALKGAPVDPAWTELFKQAVGNAVMFQSTWTPDAATELKNEAWLADPKTHLFDGLKTLGDWGATSSALVDGLHELVDGDQMRAMREREAADEATEAQAEVVTSEEAHWLESRIGRAGGLDVNERALLDFIRENARSVDPSLLALADRLGGAPAAAPELADEADKEKSSDLFGKRGSGPFAPAAE